MNSLLKSRVISRSCFQQDRERNDGNRQNHYWKTSIMFGSALSGVFVYYFYIKDRHKLICSSLLDLSENGNVIGPGIFRNDLPTYTLAEVNNHSTKDTKIWVTYKEGVYDITDFIEGHPGGEQILMAAGSSVEPFWLIYGIHENPHVYEILETLRIGNLNRDDQKELSIENMNDPYAKEPRRHTALKPASVKPFNAELSPQLLCENFLTPNELFYVRNHLPVPEIDVDTYELEIEVEDKSKILTFTLDELKKFPKHTITATIMCAGNRRSEMTKVKPVKGLSWGPGAIGTAQWTGVRLRDVLKLAGVTDDEERLKHVQFEGIDFDATSKQYGASIPLWKAVDKRGDVILAYEMNGVPIPRDHGYPVRVIVPGIVGARNVKWLGKIYVSESESSSHWQQNDYKGFSPCVDWDTVDFTKSPAIQELPVISAICRPLEGDKIHVEDGFINVKGYAWSGGGQKIVRVDVTIDGGKTWQVANFDAQDSAPPPRHWAWTLWSIKIPVNNELNEVEIWAKATDSSYNTQPENFENIWNLRGVLSNAYHKVKVKLIH
ncbi:probable sulfite oxidase, mitochondrial isoform X2 [Sitophilus oryzae]|uniref:Sulfite oxidase n=1 Tax=Sitophilus oryzae TaxID=7048 RepID=A0A6J2XZH9_SITOR|nr:probable sulfite oxidase, mitochondrial isoform X2 [Sitophilus oryzae]